MGADLANIVNEAQMAAVRAGRSAITAKDMYAGVDRFTQVRLSARLWLLLLLVMGDGWGKWWWWCCCCCSCA